MVHLLGSIVLQSLPPEKKCSWPEHLGDLVFAYNTTPHSRTGFSPFFLMFRREIRLPFDNLLGDTDPDQESSPDNWVTLHQQRLQDAYHHVKRRLAQAAHYRKMVHDSKAKVMDLQIGDRVYLRQHVLGRNKIQDAYGPKVYKVIQRRGSQTIHKWTVAPEVGRFHIGAFTDVEPGHWGGHQVSAGMEPICQIIVYNHLPPSDTIHK